MNKDIKQQSVCWLSFVTNSTGAHCAKMSPVEWKICSRCIKTKVPYIDLNTKHGSITADNPMELLCVDFTTKDPSNDVKEQSLL